MVMSRMLTSLIGERLAADAARRVKLYPAEQKSFGRVFRNGDNSFPIFAAMMERMAAAIVWNLIARRSER
jgi:hypothetical protein